jgi:hypothetical protein
VPSYEIQKFMRECIEEYVESRKDYDAEIIEPCDYVG